MCTWVLLVLDIVYCSRTAHRNMNIHVSVLAMAQKVTKKLKTIKIYTTYRPFFGPCPQTGPKNLFLLYSFKYTLNLKQ